VLAGIIDVKRKVRLVEIDEPTLDGTFGQILFQPELACLCGSDTPFFTGQAPEFPGVVGQSLHEMIGAVIETTGNKFKAGDRVLCVPKNHLGLCQRFVTRADSIGNQSRGSLRNTRAHSNNNEENRK
jgi:threonine dehydrogenase-like Zn-dependent dehydrogenase